MPRSFDVGEIGRQIAEIASKSVPLVIASGFAIGAVMTLHTRDTLVTVGATAEIPTVQSLAFFVEIGALVVGLFLAGRVGSGIGAVLANMRATALFSPIVEILQSVQRWVGTKARVVNSLPQNKIGGEVRGVISCDTGRMSEPKQSDV